jgi:hypothetical protein
MPYRILPYTKKRARELGVTVKPSKKPKVFKIDVIQKNGSIVRCGSPEYADYPTYLNLEKKGFVPRGYASTRRRLYKNRHQNDRHLRGSRGWYADKLLW